MKTFADLEAMVPSESAVEALKACMKKAKKGKKAATLQKLNEIMESETEGKWLMACTYAGFARAAADLLEAWEA